MNTLSGIGISIDGGPIVAGAIDVHQEWIDASTMTASKPDPNWTYVDAHGHFHAYDDDGKLPTLETKSRHIELSDAEDQQNYDNAHDEMLDPDDYEIYEGYDEQFFACRICGEEIEPKRVPDNPERMIPGRKSWTVEVETALRRGTDVSIVAKMEGRTVFGVGHVSRVQLASGGIGRSEIVGTADMGVRTEKASPDKRKSAQIEPA